MLKSSKKIPPLNPQKIKKLTQFSLTSSQNFLTLHRKKLQKDFEHKERCCNIAASNIHKQLSRERNCFCVLSVGVRPQYRGSWYVRQRKERFFFV